MFAVIFLTSHTNDELSEHKILYPTHLRTFHMKTNPWLPMVDVYLKKIYVYAFFLTGSLCQTRFKRQQAKSDLFKTVLN